VVHSDADKEVGVAHKVKSPENQSQFFQTMMGSIGRVKLSPNKLFRLTPNAFKNLPRNLKFLSLTKFSAD